MGVFFVKDLVGIGVRQNGGFGIDVHFVQNGAAAAGGGKGGKQSRHQDQGKKQGEQS